MMPDKDHFFSSIDLRIGDCIDLMKDIEDETVDCIVTSPPYFNLRDYQTADWQGGDPECDHKPNEILNIHKISNSNIKPEAFYRDVCEKCGATRVDNQIGLEATPEDFINNLVKVFTEAKRILKPEGTIWVNIGDTYASKVQGLKNKDLIGIPWMMAFALRDRVGLYLRQDIIWAKPNPMPESVKDRCTKSHEYIFLFSKSEKYFFDHEAIMEESIYKPEETHHKETPQGIFGGKWSNPELSDRAKERQGSFKAIREMKHKRDVWNVSSKPYSEAHFAVYPPDLIVPCIRAGCPEGGTVLDPFAGSGTTGIVATGNNRNAILLELNEDYAKLIEKRYREKGTLFIDFHYTPPKKE